MTFSAVSAFFFVDFFFVVFFFVAKNKYNSFKTDKEKYAADQERIEEIIKFNANRSALIAEREAKLPEVLAEYPEKVEAARSEYLKKVDEARAEYQKKLEDINAKIAPYDEEIAASLEVIESDGYIFPQQYFIFAEFLGGKISVGDYPENLVKAIDQMFSEHPDWAILLK